VLPPVQMELAPPLILQTGVGLTVSTLVQELVHPLMSVTVTVYVPADETLMHGDVALVFHR
jgi:hypothetical protein